MLDEKDFDGMVKEFNEFDELREGLIRKSRDVVKLSKQIIYSIHRNELDSAKGLCKKIQAELKDLDKIAAKSPELSYSGSYKVAVQEFVEAFCYYKFVSEARVPSKTELGVSSDFYLLGLCDLSGELVRNAINKASKGEYAAVEKIKDLVVEIFERLMQFDFRNSELRSKFDGLKYDVKKLEDVVFQINLKSR
jgi:predicted translin family RNA/ssDNA-binding protein